MKQYEIEVLGISESRWNGSGLISLATKEKVLYSGHASEEHEHTLGVAIMLTENASKALIELGTSFRKDHYSKIQLKRTQSYNYSMLRTNKSSR